MAGDLREIIEGLEHDPDLYFYLKLNPSHIWGVEPFYKSGDLVLLSILKSENVCRPGDLCIILTDTVELVRIYAENSDPGFAVFTAANSKVPPLVVPVGKFVLYRILDHIQN